MVALSLRQDNAARLAQRTLVPLALLGMAIGLLWPKLSDPAIASWDESMHQAATRGLHDTGIPTIYRDPLVATKPDDWADSHVFLHKPPLPFALGALVMWVVGITPLALRSVSFAAIVIVALGIYFFGRRLVGWPLAAVLAAGFVALPFGFTLLQGYQFGDVTDCSLLAFLVLSFWVLSRALERDSIGFSALAGALCGAGYLCKGPLALAPLGVVCGLAILGALRAPVPRVRFGQALAFAAAAVAVAAPWTIYSAHQWPTVYHYEAHHTAGFLFETKRPFSRPFDAMFDLISETELTPWPPALTLVAGLWLAWTTLRRPSLHRWLLCLWLWGEWIPLSIAAVKVPAHAWGAVPAALLAIGVLSLDSLERPWLAGAALGALGTKWLLGLTQGLFLRGASPKQLPLATARLDLVEGLILALIGGALGLGLTYFWRARPRLFRALGQVTVAIVVVTAIVWSPLALLKVKHDRGDLLIESYSDELGRKLDGAIPERSILFIDMIRDPPCCFEKYSLMFYSGRMTYKMDAHLVDLARRRGYHPYLVSGLAQPFKRVEAVPASAWLQAFDLDAPLSVAEPPPSDMFPIHRSLGGVELLGLAIAPGDADRDRYVFYLHADTSTIPRLPVVFTEGTSGHGKDGTPEESQEHAQLDPTRMLEPWYRLSGLPWFTMTLPGPLRSKLAGLRLGNESIPLPSRP